MVNEKIEPTIYNGLVAIGRKYLITEGIGTVRYFWNDN